MTNPDKLKLVNLIIAVKYAISKFFKCKNFGRERLNIYSSNLSDFSTIKVLCYTAYNFRGLIISFLFLANQVHNNKNIFDHEKVELLYTLPKV